MGGPSGVSPAGHLASLQVPLFLDLSVEIPRPVSGASRITLSTIY